MNDQLHCAGLIDAFDCESRDTCALYHRHLHRNRFGVGLIPYHHAVLGELGTDEELREKIRKCEMYQQIEK